MRSLLLAMSRQLFRADLMLEEFPTLKSLRVLGISDSPVYGKRLERPFSYVNTHFHQEPRLDITAPPASELGRYDLIICSDVLEHVESPVERAASGLRALLKPTGFAIVCVPYGLDDRTAEHFARFTHTALAKVDGQNVLVGRTQEGGFEVVPDLVFHGGDGATLERRVFSESALRRLLEATGFTQVNLDSSGCPGFGIVYDSPCSIPMVASSEGGALTAETVTELAAEIARARRTLRQTRDSRWMRLGSRLGLGPRISL